MNENLSAEPARQKLESAQKLPAAAPAPCAETAHHGRGALPALIVGIRRRRLRRHRHQPALCAAQVARPYQGDGVNDGAVIGIVSLLIWALFFTVTLKYVLFLMRADNKGEGGMLSLMALAQNALGRRTALVFLLGVAGAALFSGDAIITPAISVLSAVEGLESSSTPIVRRPMCCRITSSSWSRCSGSRASGTAQGGGAFRPDHGGVLPRRSASLGAMHIRRCAAHPARVQSARSACAFLFGHGSIGFVAAGLRLPRASPAPRRFTPIWAISAARPIQLAWLFFVLPALMLNYLGQGALILARSGGGRQSLLSSGAGLGAAAARRARRRSRPSSPARR